MVEAAKLARSFPHLPLIFCGGGKIEDGTSEVSVARKFFRDAGIDLARIRFDDKSYNTYSNALEARKLIKDHEIAPWLLVTSAFHMPRAVGAFRTAGVVFHPYPVDYRTGLVPHLLARPNAGQNFAQLDYAIHEWVGLLAYYMRGYNEVLFPAP